VKAGLILGGGGGGGVLECDLKQSEVKHTTEHMGETSIISLMYETWNLLLYLKHVSGLILSSFVYSLEIHANWYPFIHEYNWIISMFWVGKFPARSKTK